MFNDYNEIPLFKVPDLNVSSQEMNKMNKSTKDGCHGSRLYEALYVLIIWGTGLDPTKTTNMRNGFVWEIVVSPILIDG